MGTRSYIGVEEEGGTIRGIYCHWDGYPENNGKLLIENYADPAKVAALIDLGDISSLAPEIGEKHDFNNCPAGVVNAYGRDRGESDVDTRTFANRAEFEASGFDSGAEYIYLFTTSRRWAVRDGRSAKYVPLTQRMCAAA